MRQLAVEDGCIEMIETVLHSHIARYSALQIQDLYKLLHQAAMGSEHAVSDPESARNWLTHELTEMGEGTLEPLIDPISDDGRIVRIHLRPYIAAGHAPDLLLDAFIRTANEYRGDAHLLEQFWQAAVKLEYFSTAKMEKFIRSMKTKNYPAVHHSPEYEKMYHPAYRVVALAFCPETWR
jgi:hypothetical protein